MTRKPGAKQFEVQLQRLIDDHVKAHAAFYESEVFGGPSLFFHQRALAAAQGDDFDRFAEYVYAVLTAWGMHRMGRGGAKMCAFDRFRDSLEKSGR